MKILFKTSLALATAVVIASTPLAMAKGKKLKPGENEFSASESIQIEAIAPPIASDMDNTSFTYEKSEAAELPNLIKAEIFSQKTEQDRLLEDNASDSSRSISEVIGIQPMIYDPNYTPGCSVLPMGQYYNWTPTSGQQACVYVDVPVEAKYEFWIGNQTANAQADILINHDINANYGLSYVDQTSTTGIDDESLYLHLEAGHYYFFVPATVANGGTLHFGVRSASNVDAYEKTTGAPNYWGNDLSGEGYNITGDFNYFSATLDNSGDIDNYEYILEDGVEMVLSVEDGELTQVLFSLKFGLVESGNH